MCYANSHTFTWGSSTAVDAVPLSLRCECGAMRREDIAPLRQIQAENEQLQAQLKIATEALEQIARCGCAACGPALIDLAHARTIADDALTQMSVVE